MDFPDDPGRGEIPLHFGEVPKEFHSVYLSGPFLHCIDCECELLDSDEVYSVVKAVVAGEPIFEMAICAQCSSKLAESYSDESRAAIQRTIDEWNTQQPEPEDEESELELDSFLAPADISRLDACFACGRPRSECHRHSFVGVFLGRSLVSPAFSALSTPLMICDECNGKTSENISQKTRDTWDRFVEDHFDGPPGIELDSPSLEPILL